MIMQSLRSIFKSAVDFFTMLEIEAQKNRIEYAKAGYLSAPVAMSRVVGPQAIDAQTARAVIDESEKRIKEMTAKLG
jgi:hypothetical protein